MKGNFRIMWNYQDYWIRLILLKASKTTEYGSQLQIQFSLANQPLMLQGEQDLQDFQFFKLVWKTTVPSKVKFFEGLYALGS
ncbi:hypothetical protein TorRG33x02_321120 [Trema orientale]|uniref:Uncharacterized protein n=1 Tax=Trema orientale TaxID=63057 RepID=A0A2P5BHB1_TREOI|nr:hypothetical protein TorRG33x02_321120 [Trema orientale]